MTINPLMYANTDAFLSKQKWITDEPLTESDQTLISLLMTQITRVRNIRKPYIPKYDKKRSIEPIQIGSTNFESTKHDKSTNWHTCFQDWAHANITIFNYEPQLNLVLNPTSNNEGIFDFSGIQLSGDASWQPVVKTIDKLDSLSNESCKSHQMALKQDVNIIKQQNNDLSSNNEEEKNFRSDPNKSSSSESSSKLSLRSDVMNKNIIRAIRRQCKLINSADLKNSVQFIESMEELAKSLLNKYSNRWRTWTHFNFDDFVVYLSTFTNFWAAKKYITVKKHKEKIQKVHGLLYKYSHVRFFEFISILEVIVLFKIIWRGDGLQKLFENNESLMAHKKKYMAHLQGILSRQV